MQLNSTQHKREQSTQMSITDTTLSERQQRRALHVVGFHLHTIRERQSLRTEGRPVAALQCV